MAHVSAGRRQRLAICAAWKARGEVRGGRFVSGFAGEQYALPEAVESLRAARLRFDNSGETIAVAAVAAVDPMNLTGIIVSGDRIPALPGREAKFCVGLAAVKKNAELPPPPATTVAAEVTLCQNSVMGPAPASANRLARVQKDQPNGRAKNRANTLPPLVHERSYPNSGLFPA